MVHWLQDEQYILYYIMINSITNRIAIPNKTLPDCVNKDKIIRFRWRRWGSSLSGLHTIDPPLSPPSTPAEMFWRTCLRGDSMRFLFKNKNKKLILFFWCLKTPCKISEPYDNPFWEKSNPAQRKKEKRH